MTTKDENRARWPELAAFVDAVRASGVVPAAMWVEDDDGIALAGRRPPIDHRCIELDGAVVAEAMRRREARMQAVPVRGRRR